MALFSIGGKNVSCLIEDSWNFLLAVINLAPYLAQQKCIKIHSHGDTKLQNERSGKSMFRYLDILCLILY